MRSIAVLLVALFVLAGCGDDTDADASGDDPLTTDAAGTDDTAPPSEIGGGADECVTLAEEAAPDEAVRSFPDNPDTSWSVDGSSFDEQGRAQVEVVPTPDDVGYPRFMFVSTCASGDAVLLGVYALDEGAWTLLFTTDDANVEEFAPVLP